jgi:hypothetical protein
VGTWDIIGIGDILTWNSNDKLGDLLLRRSTLCLGIERRRDHMLSEHSHIAKGRSYEQ